MVDISLRAYHREINQMIEIGDAEKAIAHCKHILRRFPKHVDTYRLLGSAYIEQYRFPEATDILLRLLSAVPDDRLAHIGISVIREQESNLDDAIWHMERAYELQSANRILQDELRRLYGLRDGLLPPRIYLTRPALARMYYKGKLYHQAIAELFAILKEDPNRLDLRLLLARIYYQLENHSEALQTARLILERLPYCQEANYIILESMEAMGKVDNIAGYLERAIELDPYYAYVSPENPTTDQIPDQAVSLEWLEIEREHEEPIEYQIPPHTVQPAPDLDAQGGLPDWIEELADDIEGELEGQPATQKNQKAEKSQFESQSKVVESLDEPPIADEDTKPVRVQPPGKQYDPDQEKEDFEDRTEGFSEWVSEKDMDEPEGENEPNDEEAKRD